MPCNDYSRAEDCPPCVIEPEDSASSSPDDLCQCGACKAGITGPWTARRAELETVTLFHDDATECRTRFCLRGDHFGAPPEKPQEPLCTHCQGPHALEDCKGLEEPEEGAETASECSEDCTCPEGAWDRFDSPKDCAEHGRKPAPAPRRPPYAVAYAVEGGALYEVAVPGDATVVAEDGVLQVLHPKRPVLAIVRITPMNMEENNG